MDKTLMLQDVYQSFSKLGENYPRIKSNLEKCYKDIQAKCDGEQFIPKENKKQKIKKLLTKFMDMKYLGMSYEGLINETASNEEELIQLLRKISEVILSYKKTLHCLLQGKENYRKMEKYSLHGRCLNISMRHPALQLVIAIF